MNPKVDMLIGYLKKLLIWLVAPLVNAKPAGDNAEEDEDLKDLPPKAADTAAPKAPAKK